jgi:hypothetical protein
MSVFQAMRGLANVPWFFPFAEMRPLGAPVGATATASATPHTKGAWAQLVASTSEEVALVVVRAVSVGTAATETSMLIDIGVGASGSEAAIMENLAIGGASAGNANEFLMFMLPVRIAAGIRISCRVQALIASDTCSVTMGLSSVRARQTLPTSVDVIGTSTADSRGTAFAGSLGDWTQITASTAQRYRAIWLVPSVIGTDIISTNTNMEIAVGAAGSEVEIGRVFCTYANSEIVGHSTRMLNVPIACDIPAGSRLSVKTPVSANPERYGVCLIGIP